MALLIRWGSILAANAPSLAKSTRRALCLPHVNIDSSGRDEYANITLFLSLTTANAGLFPFCDSGGYCERLHDGNVEARK
jgi:hypothetical protein